MHDDEEGTAPTQLPDRSLRDLLASWEPLDDALPDVEELEPQPRVALSEKSGLPTPPSAASLGRSRPKSEAGKRLR